LKTVNSASVISMYPGTGTAEACTLLAAEGGRVEGEERERERGEGEEEEGHGAQRSTILWV
jgi:hypothetical protein